MSPKTEFEWRRIFREMAERCCCFTMCVQVMILLEIYKWTSMGPELFQQKILVTKSTSYQMLQLGWSQGIFPLIKWLPIALLADVLFPRIVRWIRA